MDLRAGVQVWFEGAVWTVRELQPEVVTLAARSRSRTLAISLSVDSASVISDGAVEPVDRELVPVAAVAQDARGGCRHGVIRKREVAHA